LGTRGEGCRVAGGIIKKNRVILPGSGTKREVSKCKRNETCENCREVKKIVESSRKFESRFSAIKGKSTTISSAKETRRRPKKKKRKAEETKRERIYFWGRVLYALWRKKTGGARERKRLLPVMRAKRKIRETG